MSRCEISCIAWLVLPLALLAPPVARGGENEQEIARRVEALPPDEKQSLADRFERFNQLEPKDRDQLRRLHGQIVDSPEAADRLAVMERYSEWFRKLRPEERVKFRNVTSPDERVVLVKQALRDHQREEERLANEQRHEDWKRKINALTPHDSVVIYEWMKSFVTRNRSRIVERLPPPMKDRLDMEKDAEKQQRMLMMFVFLRMPMFDSARPDRDDFQQVTEKLSPASQQLLREQPDLTQRHQLLHGWVLKVLWDKSFPGVNDKALQEFYEKRLSGKMRSFLERLPPEERERDLRQIYVVSNMLNLQGSDFEDRLLPLPGDGGGRFFEGMRGGPGGGPGGPGEGGPRGPGEGRPEGRPGEGRPGGGIFDMFKKGIERKAPPAPAPPPSGRK